MRKSNWKCCLITLIAIFILTSVSSVAPLFAEDAIPKIVLDGLKAYKDNGPDAAIKAWIKGSAVETSLEAQSQANVFRQVETMYGKYVGYDAIMVKDIGKSSTAVYITLNFEKGPIFAIFMTYKTGENVILSYFNFNTKAEVVLPSGFFNK